MYAGATASPWKEMMERFLYNTPLAKFYPNVDKPDRQAQVNTYGGLIASADDIAGIVGLLCMPEAAHCTGSIMNANGGMKFTS
jgi:3-oxoacyl-[acyl-carrier protein] reductase